MTPPYGQMEAQPETFFGGPAIIGLKTLRSETLRPYLSVGLLFSNNLLKQSDSVFKLTCIDCKQLTDKRTVIGDEW